MVRMPTLCLALAFGFGVWSAAVLGVGGRACTPRFAWWAARAWWEIFTVLGARYMVPAVVLIAALAYAGTLRVPALRRPFTFAWIAFLAVIATFALAALLTQPNGHCVWP